MLCVTQNVRSAFSHKILKEYTFGSKFRKSSSRCFQWKIWYWRWKSHTLTRKFCNIRIKKHNIGYWNVFFDFLNEFWLDEKVEYEKATWNFRHYRAIYIIMFMQLFFDDLSDFSHILNYFMTPISIFHRISFKKLV